RCHRQNMKTSIINGSEVSRLSVAIQFLKQMKTYESSSPVEEFTRNSAFIEIHDVVASTLDMTRGVKGGNEALEYIKPLNLEEFEL
ncbi:hypothetical protein, partial [Citrobacter portucalensis]|uniref:hypothetical protein n=1 Tax=Citrobacter portucalensis TaxID=1639133 RepID=UPI002B23D46A